MKRPRQKMAVYKPRRRPGTDLSLTTLRRKQPCRLPTHWSWTSSLQNWETYCCFWHPVVELCSGSPRKLIQSLILSLPPTSPSFQRPTNTVLTSSTPGKPPPHCAGQEASAPSHLQGLMAWASCRAHPSEMHTGSSRTPISSKAGSQRGKPTPKRPRPGK